jgi:cytoskeletal protein CcmA (bactofilin family)
VSAPIVETSLNIVGENTRLEGKISLDNVSRVHGTLIGEVCAAPGSLLVLGETSVVEGTIVGDTVMIDGFVRGDIVASTKVVVSGTGRVIGNIRAPSLKIEFGAYFEGRSLMESLTSGPAASPA